MKPSFELPHHWPNTTDIERLPSVKKILLRLTGENQDVEVVRYDQELSSTKSNYGMYIDNILACLLKPQESSTNTLTHVVKLLATHGWEKTDDPSFAYESIQFLASNFATPLQSVVLCYGMSYAKQYINLVQNSYGEAFWKLSNSPDAKKWANILTLVELTLTIPLSNGHVERCFSQMKLLKTDRRTSLGEDRLDHIRIEGPALKKWDATAAVGLWWTSKNQRVNSSAH